MAANRFRFAISALALALLAGAGALSAAPASQDWPNWRGPNFNGSAEATGLPVKFSPTEGVRWSTELPGPSAGTPVIWGDRVFVSSANLEAQELLGLCLDRKDGKVLWTRKVG